MSNIDALVSTTFEAESAQRAYIITGEEPFAADYTRATGRVDGLVQQLRDAVQHGAGATGARGRRWRGGARPPAAAARDPRAAPHRRPRGRAAAPRAEPAAPGRLAAGARARARAGDEGRRVRAAGRARARRAAQRARHPGGHRRSAARSRCVFVGLALFAIRRDFAGRERAEAELNRFFDLSIDLFSIASGDGYFKRLSPAITDMLGYSVEEALQIPYLDLVHPDDRARAHDVVERQMERRRSASTNSSGACVTRTAAGARCRGARCRVAISCSPPRATSPTPCAPRANCAKRRNSSRHASSNVPATSKRPTKRCAQSERALPRAHRTRRRQHRADRRATATSCT